MTTKDQMRAEGRHAAACFEAYWADFIAINPNSNSTEWKVAIGMIFLEGFSAGIEYKQSLIEEIIQSN